jgi:hypothetical protein
LEHIIVTCENNIMKSIKIAKRGDGRGGERKVIEG